jgi:hypothetical protein
MRPKSDAAIQTPNHPEPALGKCIEVSEDGKDVWIADEAVER